MQCCSLAFLQEIMTNVKKVLRRFEVRQLRVPLWAELGLKKIWDVAMEIPGFVDHVPKEWIKRKSIRERGFFWGVLSTIRPSFVKALVHDCHKQRVALRMAREEEPRPVEVSQDWADLLLEHP